MAEGSSLEEIVEYFRLHPEALGAKELSPRAVRVVETHISYILLDGVHAYKFKKPQDYGFLNFSTLELRKVLILNIFHQANGFTHIFLAAET